MKKVELAGTHTQERRCELMTASQHWDGPRRPKIEREAKDNLKKDSGKGKKQGRVGKLGGSQSGGKEHGVLYGYWHEET